MSANARTAVFRRLALLLGCLFALSLSQAQPGFQTYARPDLGFTIGYPTGWQVSENSENGDPYFTLAPVPGSSGAGEVAVEIFQGSDIAGDLETAASQILQEVLAAFPGLREVQRSDIVVAGLPAKVVELQGTDQQQNAVTWRLVFLLNGPRGYLVILEALTPVVANYRALLDQILASFTVTPVQAGPSPVTPPPVATPAGQPQPSGEYGQIAIGQQISGVIAAIPDQDGLVYHTYVLDVPVGTQSLTIAVQGNGADLDLAVKIGSPIVSYDDVDFLDVSEVPDPSFTLETPAAGAIYIDVLNLISSPATYTLSVTAGVSTPPVVTPTAPGVNPLAPPQADPFVGIFESETLVLELAGSAGRYSGQLHFGDQTFPVSAQGVANTLTGTFESGGNAFAFTATLDGTTLVFVTDGQSYTLQKKPQENPNPLGDTPPAGASPKGSPPGQLR